MPDVTTGRSENELPALGICFEEYAYPHPVRFLPVHNDLQTLAMAYMDVPPQSEPNGKTVVLMHGKAFGGAEDHVVPFGQYAKPEEATRLGNFVELSAAAAREIPNATRVVVPDCGHIPHIEHPAQFLDAFLPFLAS